MGGSTHCDWLLVTKTADSMANMDVAGGCHIITDMKQTRTEFSWVHVKSGGGAAVSASLSELHLIK